MFWKEDENGELVPLSLHEYTQTTRASSRVARHKIGDAVVSTVFLGLEHGFEGGLPLLYETMVFAEGLGIDQLQRRYVSRDRAIKGHSDIVLKVLAYMQHIITEEELNEYYESQGDL